MSADRAVGGSVGPDNWALPWQRTATLSGQVLDHKGAPLAGARVSLAVYYYGDDDRECVLETDRDGRFRVDRFPAGVETRLKIEHPEHVTHGEFLHLLRPDREYAFHARLDRGIPLRFQMVDRNGRVFPTVDVNPGTAAKQILTGGWVEARLHLEEHARVGAGWNEEMMFISQDYPAVDSAPLRPSPDPSVWFTVDPATGDIGPPDHPTWPRVELHDLDLYDSEVDWSNPRRLVVPWILHSILTVKYPDGTPVKGARVSVGSFQGLSDRHGQITVTLHEPSPPAATLTVTKGDYSVEVPLGDGQELYRTVEMPRGGDLEVRLDADSPGFYRVSWVNVGVEGDHDLTSGRLFDENLRPGVAGWELEVNGEFASYYEGRATIQAGRVTRVLQKLESEKVTRHRVRVLGPDGRPVAGAHVRHWCGDSFTNEAGEAWVEVHWEPSAAAPDGAPPEPVRLQVAAEGFGVQDFERPHQEAFEIHLAPPAHLRVTARLVGVEAKQLTDFVYETYEPNVTVLHPKYYRGETPAVWHEKVSLPLDLTLSPGHYEIWSDRATRVEIELKPGESYSLDLELRDP